MNIARRYNNRKAAADIMNGIGAEAWSVACRVCCAGDKDKYDMGYGQAYVRTTRTGALE